MAWRRKSEGGSSGGDALRILQAERKGGRRAYTLLSARSACPEVERSAHELPAADGTPGAAMLIWRVVRRLWPYWQYATAHHSRRILPGRTLYLHLCLRHPGLSSRTSGAGRSGGAELLAIQALAVYLHLILGFRKKGLDSRDGFLYKRSRQRNSSPLPDGKAGCPAHKNTATCLRLCEKHL
ncbi:MAG: hypothetical protein ABSF99_03520 [Anaerolineales bacterium]